MLREFSDSDDYRLKKGKENWVGEQEVFEKKLNG